MPNRVFDGQQVYAQEQQHYSNEYNSKNKIQLKHTSEGLKVNADLNYVYFDQALQGRCKGHLPKPF